jgi:hypothetical protein
VQRGGCSFLQKAQILQLYQVSALLVVNTDDELFNMRIDEFRENDIHFPVAMISSVDGKSIERLASALAPMRQGLFGRVVASHECYAHEEEELRNKFGKEKENFDSSIQNIKKNAPKRDEVLTVKHRLHGVLAPSGRVHIGEQVVQDGTTQPVETFDFISATFSGHVPVGLVLSDQNARVLSSDNWQHETDLVISLVEHQRRSSDIVALFLASPDTSLIQLNATLPSQLGLFVATVSARAGGRLLKALRSGEPISLEPMHSVLHRWNDLQTLLDQQDSWPSDQKARRKLLARYNKPTSTNGQERHVSQCWNEHLTAVTEHLEL